MNDADRNNRTFFPKLVPSKASCWEISLCFALNCFAHTFVRRFIHVIVPEGEAKCDLFAAIVFLRCPNFALTLMPAMTLHRRAGPAEYQGLMNALKRKVEEGNQDIKEHAQAGVDNIQKELKEHKQGLNQEMQALKKETQALVREEMQALKQELQGQSGQLAEIMQILRSMPSAWFRNFNRMPLYACYDTPFWVHCFICK